MIEHPDTTLPGESLRDAYADLLSALARLRPEALRHVAGVMEEEATGMPRALPEGSPGARLARAWLAFTGDRPLGVPALGERSYVFTYPAHVVLHLRAASTEAAERLGRAALAKLLESDLPVVVIKGPLSAAPEFHDAVVWLGSGNEEGDELELEAVG